MTTQRDPDPDATVEIPSPFPQIGEELEDVDPEATLVREDWETTVIRRVAPHVAAVRDALDAQGDGGSDFGWENEGLRRLSRELQKGGCAGN